MEFFTTHQKKKKFHNSKRSYTFKTPLYNLAIVSVIFTGSYSGYIKSTVKMANFCDEKKVK